MLWDIESDISDSPGVIVKFSNYLRTYSLPFYCTASLWSQCGDLTYSYCLIPGITHGELKWRQPPLPEMPLSFCLCLFFLSQCFVCAHWDERPSFREESEVCVWCVWTRRTGEVTTVHAVHYAWHAAVYHLASSNIDNWQSFMCVRVGVLMT